MLFILLAHLTDAGQRRMLDDSDYFARECIEVEVPGAQLLACYAVLGQYDFMLMAEAKNAETAARLSLELGAKADIHIETLPAISTHLLAEPWESELLPFFSEIDEPVGPD